MLKTTLFAAVSVGFAGAASAQILEIEDHHERFDVAGVKLGDTPDDAIATLKDRGYECDFRGLMGADGAPVNEHGNAGYMRCKTTEMLEVGRRSYARGEMDLFFGNLDLSGTGTDASKVFVQKMVFKERYGDKPNLDTMHARIQSKYTGAERSQGKWIAFGKSAPDQEAREDAYRAKVQSCAEYRNEARRDGTTRDERIKILECALERAELNYSFMIGHPTQMTAKYSNRPTDEYSTIEITAEWPAWLRVQQIHVDAANNSKSLEAAKAGPQIDEDVETTF
jgi:hypothetical protein